MMANRTHTIFDVEIAFKDFLASLNHPVEKSLRFNTTDFNRCICPHASNRSNQDMRYKIFSNGVPSGYIKCWHCGIEADFCFKKQHEVSPEEWSKHKERLAKRKHEEEAHIRKLYSNAGKEAKRIWSNAKPCIKHDYLENKHVQSHGLRVQVNGTLLVPCFNEKLELVNIERIYLDKPANKFQKRPLKGGQRIGAFYIIGEVINPLGVIYISEGYSTAATVYESIGCPTIVSFNCGNLPYVAQAIRKLYPKAKIIIAADRDLNREGEKHAKKAASLVGGSVCLPDFTLLNLNVVEIQQEKLSDFNDLYAELLRKGFSKEAALGEVQLQLKSENIIMIADHEEKISGKQHSNDEINGQETGYPPKFKVTENGLMYEVIEKETKDVIEIPITKNFIKINGRHSDYYSGENFGLLLEFKDEDSKLKTWAMPSTLMSDAKAIETALNYRGCYVYDIKKLIAFFKASKTMKSFIGVSRVGWHIINRQRYFVLSMAVVGNGIDQKRIRYQSTDVKNPYQDQGNLEDWQENIGKYLTGQSRLLFGVSFALSSSLLDIVGAENGGVHFHGISSKGKSTLLLLCSSLFGEPENYKLSWKTTPNAIERLAVSRHDGALILDESSEFDNEHNKKLASVIYMLMNGVGKARLNSDSSLKDTLTWRCNAMSSGENPISQLLTDARERDNEGVAVRMIDISAIVGEHGVFDSIPSQFKNGHEFSEYLKDAVRKYHGTVAVAFLNLLINENPKDISALVKTIEEKIIGSLKGAQGQVMRCVKRFALAASAGELAHKLLGIKEGEATEAAITCLKAWIKARGGVKDNEATKLLKQVIAYRDAHNAMFKTIGEISPFEKDNQAGYKEKAGDNRWVHYATAHTFKQMTKGSSHDFAVETLINAGFLTEDKKKKGNAKYLRQKKIDGTNSKYYFFDGAMWNMEEPEEVTE